jgi:hypothetical protein
MTRYGKILWQARGYLLKHGWTTGWGFRGGSTCIMGAIGLALGYETPADVTDSPEATEIARLLGFQSTDEAISWNDGTARWGATVIARIDQTLIAHEKDPVLVHRLTKENPFRQTTAQVEETPVEEGVPA